MKDIQELQQILEEYRYHVKQVPWVFAYLLNSPNRAAVAHLAVVGENRMKTCSVTVCMVTPDDFLVEVYIDEAWWFRGNYEETGPFLVKLGADPNDEPLWERTAHEVDLSTETHEWIKETMNYIVNGEEPEW